MDTYQTFIDNLEIFITGALVAIGTPVCIYAGMMDGQKAAEELYKKEASEVQVEKPQLAFNYANWKVEINL